MTSKQICGFCRKENNKDNFDCDGSCEICQDSICNTCMDSDKYILHPGRQVKGRYGYQPSPYPGEYFCYECQTKQCDQCYGYLTERIGNKSKDFKEPCPSYPH